VPITNLKQQQNGFATETTKRMHMDESEQFSHRRVTMETTTKVIHYGQQQEIASLEPFPFEPDPPQPHRERQNVPLPPTPSKFIKGEFRESDYESDSIKIKPKWKPNEKDSDDPQYRKVKPNLDPPIYSTLEKQKSSPKGETWEGQELVKQQRYHTLPASASGN